MADRRHDTAIAADVSRLYELSLTIGTSLDLDEMCTAFCSRIMARLNLAAVSVWVNGDRVGAETGSLVRVFSLPSAGSRTVASDHPLARAVVAAPALSRTFDAPAPTSLADDGVPAGVVSIFRLEGVGAFRMTAAGSRTPLSDRDLNQLRSIMDVFAVAVAGCLDHRDVVRAEGARRRAESVLRESEERLDLALSGADLGSWDWSIQTGEVTFDARWAQMIGYSVDELAPSVATWKDLLHPDDAPMVMQVLQEHLEGRLPAYETEHRLRHRDGSWIWVLDRGRVLAWDDEGRPARAVGTHLDITRRRESELRAERLGRLRTIASDVLNTFLETDDLNLAVNMILARAGEFFRVSRAYLFRYREEMTLLSNSHEWCADGVEPQIENLQQLPANAFPWWNRELLAGRTIHIEDVSAAELDAGTRDVLESQDIKALLVLPVNIHGRLEGFFGFDETAAPRRWFDEETALLSLMVEAYSRAVERAIAQRNQAETTRLLADALERAEQAGEAQAAFLARMSHEIRTPLFGIIGLSRALGRSDLQPQQREQVRTLLQSAQTLHDIIGDILDFSKLNEKKVRVEALPIRPRELLEGLAQTYADEARAKGLALYCDLPWDLPRSIRVDPTHLRQILGNLLANAVKFTSRGWVNLRAETERGEDGTAALLVHIGDTGIGVPEAIREAIFEPFTQGDDSTRRHYDGTGLGLAIAQQLTELIGGRISVDSRVDVGSTFTCRIPLDAESAAGAPGEPPPDCGARVRSDDPRQAAIVVRQLNLIAGDGVHRGGAELPFARFDLEVRQGELLAALTGEDAAEPLAIPLPVRSSSLQEILGSLASPRSRPAQPVAADPHAGALAGCRLLVVEDNEVNCMVISELLTHWGCDAVIVQDGDSALQAHSDGAFDAVLTDIELPGRDGYDITREIRRREQGTGQRTPIIALTAHALAAVQQATRNADMDDFVPKPLDEERLFAAIGRFVRTGAPEQARGDDASPAADPPPANAAADRMRRVSRGNARLALGLLDTFTDSAGDLLAQADDAVAAGDAEAVRRLGHTLKGSAAMIGLQSVAELAAGLEKASDDAGRAADLVVRLRSSVADVAAEVRTDIDRWPPLPEPAGGGSAT